MSDGGRNIGYAHLAPALCGLLSYVMLGGVGRLAASAGASVVLVLVFGLWLCCSCCLPSAVSLGARGLGAAMAASAADEARRAFAASRDCRCARTCRGDRHGREPARRPMALGV